ncbi:MAG: HD domain-containing protein [Theionarchaea archaeon]|nr:HD domain-containing protein [Theionarchaea archaeon]
MNKRKYMVNTQELEKSLLDYIERDKGKSIRDPIYDYIPLSKVEITIVDSPWIQRLREIKQMGTTNRTYISANNTRFEHSLGVCYLAGEMFNSIEKNSSKEFNRVINFMEKDPETCNLLKNYEISDKNKITILKQFVRLLAVLHDVGHGPFSHISEKFIEYREEYQKFKEILAPHEICSLEMMLHEIPEGIKYVLTCRESNKKNNHLDGYKIINDFLNCKELIKSLFIPNYCNDNSLQALNMIINSQLDADKLDYLRRDAYATGSEFGIALDVKRIIANLRIHDNYLCIGKTALSAAESLIDSRYKAYRYIHTHHTKIQMDEILKRALHYGLHNNLFRIKCEEDITNPFQAKYMGKVIINEDCSLHFKYGCIDDHFVIQRIRESENTDSEKSKFYLKKFEERKLFKSFWKVSDPLTLIEDEIYPDAAKDLINKSYLRLIKELSSPETIDHGSQKIMGAIEKEIKEVSILCRLHELISKCETKNNSIEPLEIKIVKWINKKQKCEQKDIKLIPEDIIVAHLRFDPYPVPLGEGYRNRIMIFSDDQLQDLLYFSPEVRGFVVFWAVEQLFHGVYIFFSKNGLECFPEKEKFYHILPKLIKYLEKSKNLYKK